MAIYNILLIPGLDQTQTDQAVDDVKGHIKGYDDWNFLKIIHNKAVVHVSDNDLTTQKFYDFQHYVLRDNHVSSMLEETDPNMVATYKKMHTGKVLGDSLGNGRWDPFGSGSAFTGPTFG